MGSRLIGPRRPAPGAPPRRATTELARSSPARSRFSAARARSFTMSSRSLATRASPLEHQRGRALQEQDHVRSVARHDDRAERAACRERSGGARKGRVEVLLARASAGDPSAVTGGSGSAATSRPSGGHGRTAWRNAAESGSGSSFGPIRDPGEERPSGPASGRASDKRERRPRCSDDRAAPSARTVSAKARARRLVASSSVAVEAHHRVDRAEALRPIDLQPAALAGGAPARPRWAASLGRPRARAGGGAARAPRSRRPPPPFGPASPPRLRAAGE